MTIRRMALPDREAGMDQGENRPQAREHARVEGGIEAGRSGVILRKITTATRLGSGAGRGHGRPEPTSRSYRLFVCPHATRSTAATRANAVTRANAATRRKGPSTTLDGTPSWRGMYTCPTAGKLVRGGRAR